MKEQVPAPVALPILRVNIPSTSDISFDLHGACDQFLPYHPTEADGSQDWPISSSVTNNELVDTEDHEVGDAPVDIQNHNTRDALVPVESYNTRLATAVLPNTLTSISNKRDRPATNGAMSQNDLLEPGSLSDRPLMPKPGPSSVIKTFHTADRLMQDDHPHGIYSAPNTTSGKAQNYEPLGNGNNSGSSVGVAPSDHRLGTENLLDIKTETALDDNVVDAENASDAAFKGPQSPDLSREVRTTIAPGHRSLNNEHLPRTSDGVRSLVFSYGAEHSSDVSATAPNDVSSKIEHSSNTPDSNRSHDAPRRIKEAARSLPLSDSEKSLDLNPKAHTTHASVEAASRECSTAESASGTIQRPWPKHRSREKDADAIQDAAQGHSISSTSTSGLDEDLGVALPYDMIHAVHPARQDPPEARRLESPASLKATESRGTQTISVFEPIPQPVPDLASEQITELEQRLEKATADADKYMRYTLSFNKAKIALGHQRKELKAEISELKAQSSEAVSQGREKDAKISELQADLVGACRMVVQLARGMTNEKLQSDVFRQRALHLNGMLEDSRPVDHEARETIKDKEAIIADLQRDLEGLHSAFDEAEEKSKRQEQKDESDLASLKRQLDRQTEARQFADELKSKLESEIAGMSSLLSQIGKMTESEAKELQDRTKVLRDENDALRNRIEVLERQGDEFFKTAGKEIIVKQKVCDDLQSGLEAMQGQLSETHQKLGAAEWRVDNQELSLSKNRAELDRTRQARNEEVNRLNRDLDHMQRLGLDQRAAAALDNKECLIDGLNQQVEELREWKHTFEWQTDADNAIGCGLWWVKGTLGAQIEQAQQELEELRARPRCQCGQITGPAATETEARTARPDQEDPADEVHRAQEAAEDALQGISPAWERRIVEAENQRHVTTDEVVDRVRFVFSPAEPSNEGATNASSRTPARTLPWAGEQAESRQPAPWAGESAEPNQPAPWASETTQPSEPARRAGGTMEPSWPEAITQDNHSATENVVDEPSRQAGSSNQAKNPQQDAPQDGNDSEQGLRVPSLSTEAGEDAAPAEPADAPDADEAEDPNVLDRDAVRRAAAPVWQRFEASTGGMASRMQEMLASGGAARIPDAPAEEDDGGDGGEDGWEDEAEEQSGWAA